ncbi:MAG: metal-dependent transcriptional regulator [Ruminococcaceae bacterium]|nr:metal-dependent transcriptional regulator [Oscillospiraceae bacterium]
MSIQESGEMYLESILVLSKEKPSVRAIDLSEYMGFSKPSVSRALSLLKSGGFVTVSEHGFLSLTDDGKAIAEKIYERHTVLSNYLTLIGVDKDTASKDACKMEHVISDKSFEAIKNQICKLNIK